MSVPQTSISYPVVKNPKPGYYLNHTFEKTVNPAGCLFVQEHPEAVEWGNVVVFGHSMKDGSMFADLNKFRNEEYYNRHRTIQLCYQGNWYNGLIFSVQVRDESDLTCYKTQFEWTAEKKEFIDEMMDASLYSGDDVPSVENTILTMSTCHGSGERTIVQAVLLCYTGINKKYK
nr:class B sortase [Clostridium sp. HBUAS56010]